MGIQQFVESVKKEHPEVEWKYSEKMLDVIKMSDLYRIERFEDQNYVNAYVIDKDGIDGNTPVVYKLFCESFTSEQPAITARFTLTDGDCTPEERISRFIDNVIENHGYVRGGRVYNYDEIDVNERLNMALRQITAYTDQARSVINGHGINQELDRSDAIMRMSVAAKMFEHVAQYLHDSVRFAIDNREGNPHCDDWEYEFDVDYDIYHIPYEKL